MIRQIVVRPAAVDDVVEAAAWYEAHAPGLGEELVDEILRATNRAQANPELFRIVRSDGQVRRVLNWVQQRKMGLTGSGPIAHPAITPQPP